MKVLGFIYGFVNGDYFRFVAAKKKAGNYEAPDSIIAWAQAKRLSNMYCYNYAPPSRDTLSEEKE